MDKEKVKKVLSMVNELVNRILDGEPLNAVWGSLPESDRKDIKDIISSLNGILKVVR